MIRTEELREFATDFREAVEPHWCEETGVAQKWHYPTAPEDYVPPASAGQCAVTSAVLLGELRSEYHSEKFRLTTGAVYLGGAVLLQSHVMVTYLGRKKDP